MIEKITDTTFGASENVQNGKRKNDEETVDDPNPQKRIKGLYRQPTANELNRLYEAENLFNSNLFRLQIEEILQEVAVCKKVANKFEIWFGAFKAQLMKISENENEYDLLEKTLFEELNVKLPVGGDLRRTKCNFRFYKFTNLEIIGSYAVGASINTNLCVDLQITVPAETYTKNDSVNYKYHKKRAAYLAYIASYLKNMEHITDLEYSWQDGLETKPMLTFKPKGKLGNYISIKLYLSCASDSFKLHRLSAERNNLRRSWFFNDENEDDSSNLPTPYYNSSILFDLTSTDNNNYLKEMLGKRDNLQQAIVLLKIWLRQRGLMVSGFIISMFVAHLLEVKRISNYMSSYQIIRNVWIALKHSKWDTEGISTCPEKTESSLKELLKYFPVVFLDSTGHYNICWQMTQSSYKALCRESEFAVDLLDNMKINGFIPLFMITYNPILHFDNILRFKDLPAVKEAVYSRASLSQKLNYGTDILACITNLLYSVMSEGLALRVYSTQHVIKNSFNWKITKSINKVKNNYCEDLYFGFVLHPFRSVDHSFKGPPPTMPGAARFRAFWGEKVELRRFSDGSMRETCLWKGNSLAERRDLNKIMIEYMLDKKFGITTGTFYISSQLDSAIISKQYRPANGTIGSGDEISDDILLVFDALRADIRSLKEMPLQIASINGISPVFCHMDPFPSKARSVSSEAPKSGMSSLISKKHEKDEHYRCPPYTPVYKGIIELGYSGKWPGDIEAFRCLKAAFHNQIAKSLTKQLSLTTQSSPTHFDVLKNGFAFRMEIVHSKEITLLKRSVENGVVKHRDTDESSKAMCTALLVPKLRGAMNSILKRFPGFSPAGRLLKRFLSAHLIDDHHFPHILLELLVTHVYINSEPYPRAVSPLCGFLRVLNLFFTRDWNEMIVIDFDNLEGKKIEIPEETTEGPKPTMRIITSYDGDMAGIWTKMAPTANIMARVIVLAKKAFDYIENSLMKQFNDNLMNCFIPPMDEYDVTIHVWSELVPWSAERVDKNPAFLPEPVLKSEDVIPVLEFNPVANYIQELRSAYDQFALFFYDMYGGDTIAVLWKADIKDYRELQIANAHALKRVTVNGEVKHVPNIEAIIEDFKAIGQGLVREVTVHKS